MSASLPNTSRRLDGTPPAVTLSCSCTPAGTAREAPRGTAEPHELLRNDKLRRLWRRHWREVMGLIADREARLTAISAAMAHASRNQLSVLLAEADALERAPLPRFPEELRGLTCGARTRAGTPCRLTSLHANGRCKLHGGMSTGPRTDSGRARSHQNLQRRPAASRPDLKQRNL